MRKIKVIQHVKRKPYKNDSMFYFGKHIATVTDGIYTIIVESAGEMRAAFSENGKAYQNEDLAKQLSARGYTDKKLNKIGSNDLISLNNWFRIFSDNDPTDLHEDIAHNYDDAIALAKERLKK